VIRFWLKGEDPGDIPDWAYRYLVLRLRADPDILSRCRCVEQLDFLEKRPVVMIRIFDAKAPGGSEIRDFASLDRHPERILYEGYLDKTNGEVVISPPR